MKTSSKNEKKKKKTLCTDTWKGPNNKRYTVKGRDRQGAGTRTTEFSGRGTEGHEVMRVSDAAGGASRTVMGPGTSY